MPRERCRGTAEAVLRMRNAKVLQGYCTVTFAMSGSMFAGSFFQLRRSLARNASVMSPDRIP